MSAVDFVEGYLQMQVKSKEYVTGRVKEYMDKRFPGIAVQDVVLRLPGQPAGLVRQDDGSMLIQKIEIDENSNFANPEFFHVFILVDGGMVGLIETFVVKPDVNREVNSIVDGLGEVEDEDGAEDEGGVYIDDHGLWLNETDMWIYTSNGMRFRID